MLCLRCPWVSLFRVCVLVAARRTRLLRPRLRLPLLTARKRVFTPCFCQQTARQDLSAKRQLCGDVGFSAQISPPSNAYARKHVFHRISTIAAVGKNGFATAISSTICIVCLHVCSVGILFLAGHCPSELSLCPSKTPKP